ncbi:hypothetical protein BB561_003245 [Smittium simulii]|uniref:HTH merR-type domain-containing protein n=1 Tax=Smittium simulii TaxID=133385 RepID=A0A2T9YMF0_9FUNG|nr:hypothetical protein BB561_003245 [Smittium simulii]
MFVRMRYEHVLTLGMLLKLATITETHILNNKVNNNNSNQGKKGKKGKAPKSRAIGATIAARTGISTDTARRYEKSGFIENQFIEECPFYRKITLEIIKHMLLECSRWQALRTDILAQYINIYRGQVASNTLLLPALISMRLVGKLVGEELKLSSTRIHKDPTVLCVKTTLATAKFLNAISLPRYLMLNSIRLVPIYRNQFPLGSDTVVSQKELIDSVFLV